MPYPDWNERYKTGEIPWDTNEPDEHLVKLINSKTISPCKTLEVGCGTGTNSLWLAHHGFSVLGMEIAPAAIEMAKQKKGSNSLACEFVLHDFIHDKSLSQSFDFVFDRGCFHVFDEQEERVQFARRVSLVLNKNGTWVSLIGSTEGGARDTGPPRRTASEVITAIEPFLEIVELRSVFFQAKLPFSPRAWLCIAKLRDEPAQPSTRR